MYHNHFVLNPVSLIDGHKFFNSPADYQAMKRESDRLCLEYRISVIEEPLGRGRNYGEYLAEKNGKPTNRSLIRDDIDRAIKASMTEREFFRNLEQMGYEMKLYTESGRPLKYPALRPPGAKGFFRFHKLGGEEYTLEQIRQRVANNFRRQLPFAADEQEAVRTYRTQNRPQTKATGLHALYIRYCFELHIIEKHPASVKRVSFFMREDLIHLERLDAQTRFLGEHGIDTLEDLHTFQTEAQDSLQSLEKQRKALRNARRRAVRAGDPEETERISEKIAETTSEMTRIRKDLKLCDGIEERSAPMAEELRKLSEEQIEKNGKEEQSHEQLFRGRGRTGRENEPGRR